MNATIQISEAQYVDPRSGHDKFYRVFAFGNRWTSQYGRNNTFGTFTKVVEAADEAAAAKAAAAKLASKVRKGYEPTRSGTVTLAATISDSDLTVLDHAAARLSNQSPDTTQVSDPVSEPIPAADLPASEQLADRSAVVTAALADITSRAVNAADLAPRLPVRPMLASVQDAATVAAAMDDPVWLAQFKYDGDRVAVEITDGQIRVLNRQGQPKVRNVGQSHLLPFTALHSGRWVFDGEVVGRTLVLFDVAAASVGGRTWAADQTPFTRRYRVLEAVADVLGIPAVADATENSPVVLAPLAVTSQDKADFLTVAVNEKREGIILRHRDGVYEQGRRSTLLVKHKLVKDADVVVSAIHPVKESVELSVYDGTGQLVPVGQASTIGKSVLAGPEGVQVGQTWLVTFLYVTNPEHPRLTQPRLVARRHDKDADECLLTQFADAGTNKKV